MPTPISAAAPPLPVVFSLTFAAFGYTSLGIQAFGPMVTRFVSIGYQRSIRGRRPWRESVDYDWQELYERGYARFRTLYPALRPLEEP